MTALESLCKRRRRILFESEFVSTCLQELSLIECVETLLSVEDVEKAYTQSKMSTSRLQLAKSILPLVVVEGDICAYFSKLLRQILDDNSPERCQFLNNLWQYYIGKIKDHVGISLIEDLVEKYPTYIEAKLLNIFSGIIGNDGLRNNVDGLWADEQLLITLCAESSLIFSIVSSMLNEILLQSRNGFATCLQAISSFVANVSLVCTKSNKCFTDLYPHKYQNLIRYMNTFNICKGHYDSESDGNLKNEYLSILNNVANHFHESLQENPKAVITLLSHQGVLCKSSVIELLNYRF